MKKIISIVLSLLFVLSFSGCDGNGVSGEESSLDTNETTKFDAEQPNGGTTDETSSEHTEESTIDDISKEIYSIADISCGFGVGEAEEGFYSDSTHIYTFPNTVSKYIIVSYTDGTAENVKEALASNHIKITDLDKYGIGYSSEAKMVENIVDLTEWADDAIETFYQDENYIYTFSCIKSQYITVYYKDGSEQNVKDALAEGKIRITDLGYYGISYSMNPTDEMKEFLLQWESPDVPDDFSFSLTWNCFGVSSYDSESGKLVKTTDATHPEDFVTYHELTEEEKERIYRWILLLNVNSYPYVYDPGNGLSDPSMTLILTIRMGDSVKTIEAKDIALSYRSENPKGQLFLGICRIIHDMLETTEEWQALPPYEYIYG